MRSDDAGGSTRPRIAIVSASQSIEGGAEVVLQNLLQHYEHPEELILVCPGDSGLESCARERGVQWVEFPSRRDALAPNAVALVRILNQLKGVRL